MLAVRELIRVGSTRVLFTAPRARPAPPPGPTRNRYTSKRFLLIMSNF